MPPSNRNMNVRVADWIDQQIQRLAREPITGYLPDDAPAAEPVALAALAACAAELPGAAEQACRQLFSAQNQDGSVAVWLDEEGPFWPTSLACIAWRQFQRRWPDPAGNWCDHAHRRGIAYLLGCGGDTLPPGGPTGHDTTLVGWPWVLGTHSWLEPTSMALLALRHADRVTHPRADEAIRLLIDRQIPTGGANYGNTLVLDQMLVPHVMPSAMSATALHGIESAGPCIRRCVDYLRRELADPMAATSLMWTAHAIAGAGPIEDNLKTQLATSIADASRRLTRIGGNPHRQNQLLLAAMVDRSPLLDLPHQRTFAEPDR